MAAPSTIDELLELVHQSGLADESRIGSYVAGLTATQSLPPDPGRFASVLVHDGLLTRFQAEQLLLGKWKGFNLGLYEILERIGVGQSAAFYLGEHTSLQRVVALKVLPPASAELPGNLAKFYREARATAACNHPHVVQLYEVSQDGNLHFLALEYIDGPSLYELVRRGPLDPVRAAHYLAQAAAALRHLHELGLVHRNVKPQKLLLGRGGRVKLCGLGVALVRQEARQVDQAVCGTPNYIAPEQALDSAGVDGRADVYSLGCTAYHLLTGRPPFQEGSAAQKMLWHQTREPEAVRSLRPGLPEGQARVVERKMQKAPHARNPSAAEVEAALAPWCATPIPSPPAEELPSHCPRVREAIERSPRAPQ
jgi:serine/threonine protein kinase